VLAQNAGIATPSNASRPRNLHGVVGLEHGESDEDSDSDEDGEAAENSDVLAAVEEENPSPEVVDLTNLDWEEYTIDVAEPLQTRTRGGSFSPVCDDHSVPPFRSLSRKFVGPQIPLCKKLSGVQQILTAYAFITLLGCARSQCMSCQRLLH